MERIQRGQEAQKEIILPLCDLVTEDIAKIGYNNATRKKNAPQRRSHRKEIKMSAVKLGKNNFSLARESDKPVLLDFYADWCGPCRMVSPIVDEIAEENPEYFIGKINVDKEPELAREFGVYSIPTLVVMKGGEVVKKVSGARSKPQLLALIED